MKYLGHTIEREHDHVKVTSPAGEVWREDTTTDAIREINNHRGTPNHIIACGTQTREKPVPSYTRKELEEYNGME